MNNAANIQTADYILTIELDDMVLTYSAKTDRRVFEAIDGKVFTKTKKGAEELAAEMRAWGVTEARALNHAVVFWS